MHQECAHSHVHGDVLQRTLRQIRHKVLIALFTDMDSQVYLDVGVVQGTHRQCQPIGKAMTS